MAYRPSLERITKTDINLLATGNTSLGFTENGTQRFYPILAVVRVKTASGVLTVGTVSVGTNSTTYNNIMPATLLTGLTIVDQMLKIDIASSSIQSVAANTEIFLRVSIAATGTLTTADITILGYYA